MSKEFYAADDKLYEIKGWIVENMADFQNEFEVIDRNRKHLIDHLSEAQVIDLAKLF